MNIAIHYNADHPSLGGYYGPPVYKRVFSTLLEDASLNINSEARVGDVPFYRMKERAIKLWMGSKRWRQFYADIGFLQGHNIFVITLTGLNRAITEHLDSVLRKDEAFLGIFEIDETVLTHLGLYRKILVPFGHILGKTLFLYWDGASDDSKDFGMADILRELPFEKVGFEARSPFED